MKYLLFPLQQRAGSPVRYTCKLTEIQINVPRIKTLNEFNTSLGDKRNYF